MKYELFWSSSQLSQLSLLDVQIDFDYIISNKPQNIDIFDFRFQGPGYKYIVTSWDYPEITGMKDKSTLLGVDMENQYFVNSGISRYRVYRTKYKYSVPLNIRVITVHNKPQVWDGSGRVLNISGGTIPNDCITEHMLSPELRRKLKLLDV